jgi:hypothetical protein
MTAWRLGGLAAWRLGGLAAWVDTTPCATYRAKGRTVGFQDGASLKFYSPSKDRHRHPRLSPATQHPDGVSYSSGNGNIGQRHTATQNPNGVSELSPGLARGTSAYPGFPPPVIPTPTGLRPDAPKHTDTDATPLGLGCGGTETQGSLATLGNPGLSSETPLGFEPLRSKASPPLGRPVPLSTSTGKCQFLILNSSFLIPLSPSPHPQGNANS